MPSINVNLSYQWHFVILLQLCHFYKNYFFFPQDHNKAVSHAHTPRHTPDLHPYLRGLRGVCSTFSNNKMLRVYEIQSSHNSLYMYLHTIHYTCSYDLWFESCSWKKPFPFAAIYHIHMYFLLFSVTCTFGRFVGSFGLRLGQPIRHYRIPLLIQNCSGKMVQLGAISGIVCIKIHIPNFQLKCGWHRNWHKLRKEPGGKYNIQKNG